MDWWQRSIAPVGGVTLRTLGADQEDYGWRTLETKETRGDGLEVEITVCPGSLILWYQRHDHRESQTYISEIWEMPEKNQWRKSFTLIVMVLLADNSIPSCHNILEDPIYIMTFLSALQQRSLFVLQLFLLTNSSSIVAFTQKGFFCRRFLHTAAIYRELSSYWVNSRRRETQIIRTKNLYCGKKELILYPIDLH